jgi:hypothetical protein
MVIAMMGINDFGYGFRYEPISDSKAIIFLKFFRAYELTRLPCLHLVNRLSFLQKIKLDLGTVAKCTIARHSESEGRRISKMNRSFAQDDKK